MEGEVGEVGWDNTVNQLHYYGPLLMLYPLHNLTITTLILPSAPSSLAPIPVIKIYLRSAAAGTAIHSRGTSNDPSLQVALTASNSPC